MLMILQEAGNPTNGLLNFRNAPMLACDANYLTKVKSTLLTKYLVSNQHIRQYYTY